MDTPDYLRFALTFVLVIGLILALGLIMRRFGNGGGLPLRRKGPRRLSVVESLAVDSRRRLVLVRRDGVEHLILVGGATDLVVETGLTPPADFVPASPITGEAS